MGALGLIHQSRLYDKDEDDEDDDHHCHHHHKNVGVADDEAQGAQHWGLKFIHHGRRLTRPENNLNLPMLHNPRKANVSN